MGKRFECSNVDLGDLIGAYLKLGLGQCLGQAGVHTALEQRRNLLDDMIEVDCIPGRFTAAEYLQLMVDAGIQSKSVCSQ